jgi:hypothetical protein
MTNFQKLLKYWPWCLVIAVILGLGAWGVNASIKQTVSAHGEEMVGNGWFTTFWGLLSGGAAFSIPALIALVKKLLPMFGVGAGVSSDPRINQVIDAAQIGSYLFLLSKAKSAEESQALTTAGRASFDSLRDGLFPLTAFPVIPVPVPPVPPVA